MKLKELNQF